MKFRLNLLLGAGALLCAAQPAAASATQDNQTANSIRAEGHGVEFAYVDPRLRVSMGAQYAASALGAQAPASSNPIYQSLSRAAQQYRATWGRLPQVQIPAGAPLKLGATGARAELLRQRLGLAPGAGYDATLADRISEYQRVHGLPANGDLLDQATLASLNKGAGYYLQRIAVNLNRAAQLPAASSPGRYVVVDAGAAQALLYRDGQQADAMRVVVGAPKTQTPMMASLIQVASFNPYWNVPADLIQSLTAKRVLEQGVSYLRNYHYEVLSDWSVDAPAVDPTTINWRRVAAGKEEIRVRQLPGPWNSMGAMKFEISNDFGIYLHDTPHKELFAQDERHVSNGCIRLEDYRRFANWVFGEVPEATSEREQRFSPPTAVPVYVTYLTVAAGAEGLQFRPDPYGWDDAASSGPTTGSPIQLASAD